jgi:magnesium-transporting ATPase (P-type)
MAGVAQRVRNMTELRKMAPQPYAVRVFRLRTWTEVPSSQLLPGDLISLGTRAPWPECSVCGRVCRYNEA